jgi:hypothetical protein
MLGYVPVACLLVRWWPILLTSGLQITMMWCSVWPGAAAGGGDRWVTVNAGPLPAAERSAVQRAAAGLQSTLFDATPMTANVKQRLCAVPPPSHCTPPAQTAADALLAYAFGRDADEALPGTMADAVAVRVAT